MILYPCCALGLGPGGIFFFSLLNSTGLLRPPESVLPLRSLDRMRNIVGSSAKEISGDRRMASQHRVGLPHFSLLDPRESDGQGSKD